MLSYYAMIISDIFQCSAETLNYMARQRYMARPTAGEVFVPTPLPRHFNKKLAKYTKKERQPY